MSMPQQTPDLVAELMNVLGAVPLEDARRGVARALSELEESESGDVFGRRPKRQALKLAPAEPRADESMIPAAAVSAPESAAAPAAVPECNPAAPVSAGPTSEPAPAELADTVKRVAPPEVLPPSVARLLRHPLAATLTDEPSRRTTLPDIRLPGQVLLKRADPDLAEEEDDSELFRAATRRDFRPLWIGAGLLSGVALLVGLLWWGTHRPPRAAAPPSSLSQVAAPAAQPAPAAASATVSAPPAPPTEPSSPRPAEHARRTTRSKPAASPADDIFGRWR
jgi:hypothetical protein